MSKMSTESAGLRPVFITHEFFPKMGGAATVVHEMATAAVALGHETEVLAPGKADLSAPGDLPYQLTRMGHRGKQDWLARISLLRFLARRPGRPDERWIIAEPGALRACLYAPLFGIRSPNPPIVILHGSEILRFTALPHRKALLRRLLEGTARVHLLSAANRELLLTRLPGLEANLAVVPGAPSVPVLEAQPVASSPDGRITILTVGRIHPRKGQLETLQALMRLDSETRNRVRYRIVGPCVRRGYLSRIQKLVRCCDFPVELSGALSAEELDQAYREAGIFAMNSRRSGRSVEGFGLAYLDASAFGLPVVANHTGGVSEAVLDGKTGLLVPEGDTTALTTALARLIEDPALRNKLGHQGRAYAARHSWKETTRRVLLES